MSWGVTVLLVLPRTPLVPKSFVNDSPFFCVWWWFIVFVCLLIGRDLVDCAPTNIVKSITRVHHIQTVSEVSLTKISEKLHITNKNSWRAWLKKNHDSKNEIWLVYFKKHTGKPRIPYDDAVEEALCFGWIDSIVQKIDDERFAQKFTPRKSKSKWSELNKRRARRMIKEGRMTNAGLTKIKEAENSGEWSKNRSVNKELVVPPYIKEAFAAKKKVLDNYNDLAPGYKRQIVGWISSAKKDETRMRRLAEAIRLLEQNKKLDMK